MVLAGLFLGTFGVGMKHIAPMAWEAWWLIYSLLSLLLFPLAWALAVPSLWDVLAAAHPGRDGKRHVLRCAVGDRRHHVRLQHPLRRHVDHLWGGDRVVGRGGGDGAPAATADALSSPAFPYILLGILVMLGGVVVAVYAGMLRDRQQVAAGKEIAGVKAGREFRLGLLIVAVCGAFSSVLNVGYVAALPVAGDGTTVRGPAAQLRLGGLGRGALRRLSGQRGLRRCSC